MIPKRFEDIEFSDFEALRNNQVAEGKTIEYKKELVTTASSDKEPFLEGVSAFANTIGGDFIIGIEAKDGIPVNLSGVNFAKEDAEILKLEQILLNGLEPRLPSINIRGDIQSPTGEKFILIRVNRSWIAPHRVKANNKFYGRNSKGKYPLDVSELRTAFMLTEQLSERIKGFREDRVKSIGNYTETPVELIEGGKLIFHAVPLSAFTVANELNISKIYNQHNLGPIIGSGYNRKINLDGVVNYSGDSDGRNYAYTQIFRNGCVESVYIFRPRRDGQKYIPSVHYETTLVRTVKDLFNFFSSFDIEPPIYLFLTFIDVKEHYFGVDPTLADAQMLDRNDLFLPEVIADSYATEVEKILRPLFDKVWNAYGFSRCFNYDEDGKRIIN